MLTVQTGTLLSHLLRLHRGWAELEPRPSGSGGHGHALCASWPFPQGPEVPKSWWAEAACSGAGAPELPTRPRAAPAPWPRVAPRCCLHFPLPLGMDWLSMDTVPGHRALPCGHHGCRGDSLSLSPVAGPIVGLRLLHICWWFEKLSRSLSVLRAGF